MKPLALALAVAAIVLLVVILVMQSGAISQQGQELVDAAKSFVP